MSRSLTILAVLLGFGLATVASAGGNVDWSQFVEKPGDKPFKAAPPANRMEVPKSDPAPAAAPTKGKKTATKAKPAAKAKAKSKAARGRHH